MDFLKGIPKKLLIIFFLLLFIFSYFYQGGGWNQAAVQSEIRGIIEHGEMFIPSYTSVTGDIISVEGKTFSNKSPNITFFALPPYFLFYQVSKLFHIDTSSLNYNFAASHFLTIVTSSIWGALLSILIFYILKDLYPKLKTRQNYFLSLFIPLSTSIFPYSTMSFRHSFETCVLYLNILLLIKFYKKSFQPLLVGFGFGLLVLANPLNIIFIFFYIYLLLKKRVKDYILFGVSSVIPLIPLLVYNYLNFKNPFLTNQHFYQADFKTPGFILGVFGPLEFSRLYSIFFKDSRSLLFTQMWLFLSLAGGYIGFKEKLYNKNITIFIIAQIIFYLLFILSYNGWTGGIAFGYRLLIPFFLLLAILTVPFFIKFPKISGFLILLSAIQMFMVTSVATLACYGDFIACIIPKWKLGEVAISNEPLFPNFVLEPPLRNSFNLGHLLGLKGPYTLVPLLLIFAFMTFTIFYKRQSIQKRERRD